jgi:hypothetical protein
LDYLAPPILTLEESEALMVRPADAAQTMNLMGTETVELRVFMCGLT